MRCILPAIKNYVPATVKEVEVVDVQADSSHIIQGANSAKKPAHRSINAKKRSNKCILSEEKLKVKCSEITLGVEICLIVN